MTGEDCQKKGKTGVLGELELRHQKWALGGRKRNTSNGQKFGRRTSWPKQGKPGPGSTMGLSGKKRIGKKNCFSQRGLSRQLNGGKKTEQTRKGPPPGGPRHKASPECRGRLEKKNQGVGELFTLEKGKKKGGDKGGKRNSGSQVGRREGGDVSETKNPTKVGNPNPDGRDSGDLNGRNVEHGAVTSKHEKEHQRGEFRRDL